MNKSWQMWEGVLSDEQVKEIITECEYYPVDTAKVGNSDDGTENNAVRYFSSLPLEESIDDDYRFESDFWNPWAEFNPNLYE